MNRKNDLRELTTTREVLAERLRCETRLSGEEEKLLRMRYGCSLDPDLPLTHEGAGDPDLQAELLLLEYSAVKAAQIARRVSHPSAPSPQASREKSAIVQALRHKHR
ncbi:MAG: hypothetical protein LBM75_00965 [Myxococcales bacterium]|jgi:hypothetical protein|nr:hypothetical protein [Myxococcales bacterium]